MRLRVYDRLMCFVNCHLAAHLDAVNRRNSDFDHIYRNMTFTRSSNLLNNTAGMLRTCICLALLSSPHIYFGCFILVASLGSSLLQLVFHQQLRCFALQMYVYPNSKMIMSFSFFGKPQVTQMVIYFKATNPDEGKPDLAEADMVVFFGDFNYRLFGISYDEARDFVSQRSFDWLREKDQLRAEMKAGKVFQGMREALVRFPPTYKFERGKAGLGGNIVYIYTKTYMRRDTSVDFWDTFEK